MCKQNSGVTYNVVFQLSYHTIDAVNVLRLRMTHSKPCRPANIHFAQHVCILRILQQLLDLPFHTT